MEAVIMADFPEPSLLLYFSLKKLTFVIKTPFIFLQINDEDD